MPSADAIEARQRAGESLDDIAILVPRRLPDPCLRGAIPHHRPALPRDRRLALLRAPGDPGRRRLHPRRGPPPDDDLAFERIVNLPKRGLGEVSLRPVHLLARGGRHFALPRGAERLIETDELKPRARSAVAGLIDQLRGWRAALAEKAPVPRSSAKMLDESGYTEMWQKDRLARGPRPARESEGAGRRALSSSRTSPLFLDHVSLVHGPGGRGARKRWSTS